MARKKTAEPRYIAIDTTSDEVIHIGNRREINDFIQNHVEIEGLDEDECEHIKVFELGAEQDLIISCRTEVTF